MNGEVFEQAKAAASAFLDRMRPSDSVALMSFAGKTEVLAKFSAPRSEVRDRLSSLQVDSTSMRTVLLDGVYDAEELVRRGNDRRRPAFVILLSDSQDGGSRHKLEEAINLAKGNESQPRIPVFAIGYTNFGRGGVGVLQRLSKETGGDFIEAAEPDQLNTFFDNIVAQMTKGYVARFKTELDGKTHRIEVSTGALRQAREVPYPLYRRPLWPFAAGGGVAALGIGLLGWLALQRRPVGRLVFVAGTRSGDSISLRSGRIRIGSLPDNDVCIPSGTVSRYHAEIYVTGRRVSIQDLHSTNGVQINGMQVETSPLRPGDRIKIADVDLVFER
jgi:hypothetical protein